MAEIVKQKDKFYVTFPEIRYATINKSISTVLFIYSFIQLILLFYTPIVATEIPKNIYSTITLVSFFLSSIALSLAWFGVKQSHIVCPSG